ncbi:tripartite tricarboxylate transporter permease [Treponema primitia]|uniref:tripartite tricarboxylate transporter permease n=1 Tax=Treponema primitia TaxID=88058 RepID=UPI003980F5ED
MNMEFIGQAFANLFSLINLFYLIFGSVAGLVIGILPGLGPTFACALFLPFTFGLPADSALILLSAVYASTAYGEGITSILINVPGGPGAVALTFDGYPLTKKGRASYALGALAGASLVGGLIGVFSLIFIAPKLSNIALLIGPAQFFMMALLGLSLVATVGKGDTAKGLILGCLGLIITTIGTDVITGSRRFNFGSDFLMDGIPFVSATIGLFAMSQVIMMSEDNSTISGDYKLGNGLVEGLLTNVKHWFTTVRSSILGVLVGIMPGIGISIASFMGYIVEQKLAGEEEAKTFGTGNVRGVIAPQAACNACVSGELIPALSLGIPGGATSAIFLAALSLHGLRPGLSFFSSGGTLVYTVFLGMIFAQVVFFILGSVLAKQFALVTKTPNALLVSVVLILCFAGAFAVRKEVLDIVITMIFGLIGYVLFKNKWPIQCLILGMVLGPIAENNFHRALQISRGSYAIFIGDPFTLIVFIVILAILIWTFFGDFIMSIFKKKKA